MLKTAESLAGPYVWGQYDVLVLPPSFPYGGMENPCLTFATPTLLVRTHTNTISISIYSIWQTAFHHAAVFADLSMFVVCKPASLYLQFLAHTFILVYRMKGLLACI